MGKCKMSGGGGVYKVTNGCLQFKKSLYEVVPPYTFVQEDSYYTDKNEESINLVHGNTKNNQLLDAVSLDCYTVLLQGKTTYSEDASLMTLMKQSAPGEVPVTVSECAVPYCVKIVPYKDCIIAISYNSSTITFRMYTVSDDGFVLKHTSSMPGSGTYYGALDACVLEGINRLVVYHVSIGSSSWDSLSFVFAADIQENGEIVRRTGTNWYISSSSYRHDLGKICAVSNKSVLVVIDGYWQNDNYTSARAYLLSIAENGDISEKTHIGLSYSEYSISSSSQEGVVLARVMPNVVAVRHSYDENDGAITVLHVNDSHISEVWKTTSRNIGYPFVVSSNMFCIASHNTKTDVNYQYAGGVSVTYYKVTASGITTSIGFQTYWAVYGKAYSNTGVKVVRCGDYLLGIPWYAASGNDLDIEIIPGAIISEGLVPADTDIWGITFSKATIDKAAKYWRLDIAAVATTMAVPSMYIADIKNRAIDEIQQEVNENGKM